MLHQFYGRLPLALNTQSPTPRPLLQRNSQIWTRVVCVKSVGNGNGLTGADGRAGLPLSMFTPYKQLPPEGEVVPAVDAACDPTVQKCKTLVYTYESRCISCSGTGFVKRSYGNSRRASLCTCLPCHGLGYVRRTTTRFVPDLSDSGGVFTMGRSEQDPILNATSKGHVKAAVGPPHPQSPPQRPETGARTQMRPGRDPERQQPPRQTPRQEQGDWYAPA
ncbi:hypothetical protein Vretimale_9676 [Volvox reticuliferus]|uniref:Uncharacterized protein n=1 Tax=Volvox reticuliferus TaxID=1737510 RepID=A0A8J4FPI2_9CHLO|nr:hypothetical protein Vretifemale_13432 [Volvox reticuliferus]GIM05225.1 hypothetical protein Vretimale_9676 [Volvox reticuliferus]